MTKCKRFFQNLVKPFTALARKDQNEADLEDIAVQAHKQFSFQTLSKATNNFHPDQKLGEGGFDPVFKLIISTILMTVGIAIVTWTCVPSSFTIYNFGTQKLPGRLFLRSSRRRRDAVMSHVSVIKDYRSKIESEHSSVCDNILKLLETKPIGTVGDSKVFYLKMRGDYHRYLAEFKTDYERKEAAENTLNDYKSLRILLMLNWLQHIRSGLAWLSTSQCPTTRF